jgi:hypothetical protein
MNDGRTPTENPGRFTREPLLRVRAGSIRAGAFIERTAPTITIVTLAVAFLVRLVASIPRALNPDEAINFLDANADSLFAAGLEGILASAHPPLSFMVPWLAARIDLAEWVLRLPSAIAGVAAAWIAYRLMRSTYGVGAGLIALALFGFAPPMLELGTQTRGYTLEILLLVASLHLFWLGKDRRSPWWLAASGLTTTLAIATEYSALIAAVPLGVLGLWQWFRSKWRRDMAVAWIAGQCVAVSTAILLWFAHISTVRGGGMEYRAQTGWLAREYFHPSDGNGLSFIAARSFDLFEYLFGGAWAGGIALAVIILGMFWPRWLANRAPDAHSHEAEHSGISPRLLLSVSFAAAFVVALAGLYPYGGTRHSVYLGVFVYTAGASFLAGIARRSLAALALCLLVFSIFQSVEVVSDGWDPDDGHERIREALTALAETAPADAWIFIDKQNASHVRFYRCPEAEWLSAPDGYKRFQCDGLRYGQVRTWHVAAADFDRALSEFIEAHDLAPDTPIFAVSLSRWSGNVMLSLQERGYPFISMREFGNKVAIAQVRGAPRSAH